MANHNSTLTQEYLNSLFYYKEGNLYRKVKRKGFNKNSKVGYISKNKYLKTNIDGKIYPVHRLIFVMHHGYHPETIDHIDGNGFNNNIENLRAATYSENCCNAKLRKDSSSGYKNVYWNKLMKRWGVKLAINKKQMHFGYYHDIEVANFVATFVRHKYHKEFARKG